MVPAQRASKPINKPKRPLLTLDPRIELTDEELKMARADYINEQSMMKQDQLHRKLEKQRQRMIGDLVWGPPSGLHAPFLRDFWEKQYKVQIGSRSFRLDNNAWRSTILTDAVLADNARNRIGLTESISLLPIKHPLEDINEPATPRDIRQNVQLEIGINLQDDYELGPRDSSEEPGRGRQNSQPLTFEFDVPGFNPSAVSQPEGRDDSHKSSFFPWDHAGPSSSSAIGLPVLPTDPPSVDPVDVGMRSSASRASYRGSSLASSHLDNIGRSPVLIGQSPEDYQFDVFSQRGSSIRASQALAVNARNATNIEKNSSNFLEYTKMQRKALAGPFADLTFEHIIPKQSSTRHIAASGFYHCLVLATKDLAHLEQSEAHSTITIALK